MSFIGSRVFLLLFVCNLVHSNPDFRWTMLDVQNGDLQADAHLLEFEGGETWLIDVGHIKGEVVGKLRDRKIHRVDRVFISHSHRDHYGGLGALLSSGIEIKQVLWNLPDRAQCEAEKPWGCDFEEVLRTQALVRSRGKALSPVAGGTTLHPRKNAIAQVLYAFDGRNSPVGTTDINDTSVILTVTVGKTRVLFPGDLNGKLGGYLANHGENLEADLIKMPHHGMEGLAPDTFFERVGFKVALIPIPLKYLNSERSRRPNAYLERKGILSLSNAENGDVTVEISEDGYRVNSTREFDVGGLQ